MALFLLFASLAIGYTTTAPPQFTIPCDMTSANCPSSMTCTPTSVCSDGLRSCTGVCFTTPPPLPSSACIVSNPETTCGQAVETCSPFYTTCQTANCLGTCITTAAPQTSCVVSGSLNCPTGLTCTPTETSPLNSPWHGVCITTPPPPPFQTPCVVSGTPTCPTPLVCTPTEISTAGQPWSGACITTAPPGPTSACLVSNAVTTCSQATETCSPFATSCTSADCLGTCVSAPTPTATACTFEEECGYGYRCVRKPGVNCGLPSRHCPGVCRKGDEY